MRLIWLVMLACLCLTGCATSTLESRKKERPAAYAGLTPEIRALVDAGQIKVGMPMDAVYIAWGKPAQVLAREDPGGAATIWLYEGGWLQENRYWTRRSLRTYYQPMTYVSAEVVFVSGLIQSWRTLPQPAY